LPEKPLKERLGEIELPGPSVKKEVDKAAKAAPDKSNIYVKSSNNENKKRAWDKRYFCVYCKKPFFKIARHLESKHKSEAEVSKLLQLAVKPSDDAETKQLKSRARRTISDTLRRRGNYNHNIEVLTQGFGELTVKRCPPTETSFTDYLPCEFCLEFYFRSDLHRHVKTCTENKNSNDVSSNRVQSRASMLLPISSAVSDSLKEIFKRMKVDETSMALKLDPVVIKYGNVLCAKHYNNDDQTYHISNKLRELGRLLIAMRKQKLVDNFEGIINPKLFPDVVKCVMALCGWNSTEKTIETPSLGIKLGQLLNKVCYMLKGEAIISGDNVKRTKADDFTQLIDMRWNDEIAKVSRTDLESKKWNKPQLLPLTEDLKIIKVHLVNTRNQSLDRLAQENSDINAYRNLCSSTLANLILLNRRRSGEASKLQLNHVESLQSGTIMNDEVKKSLSKFELQLCKTYKRVEIRGKRGRKVPMLVSKPLEASLNLIIKVRSNVGVNSSNKFVFAIPSSNSLYYMRGSDALRKHVKLCSLKCPQAISSTKLRKHIATLSQLINLEERELEMLAGFLGHDINVHRDFYRLPEDTLQVK